MADHQLKNPLNRTLPKAIQSKIIDAFQLAGHALPCHVLSAQGAMITVAFDVLSPWTLPVVTIPLFGPEYVRYPIQPGDKGFVIPVDTTVGNASGQGGPSPTYGTQTANLSSLFFMPLGNATWVDVDPDAVTLYGPNGVCFRDTNSGAVVTLTPNSITCVVGSTSFVINETSITATAATFTVNAPSIVLNGNLSQGEGSTSYPAHIKGPLIVDGDVTAAGTSLHTHEHGGVQTGSGDTGPPL